jgi:hypothetical protein
LDGVLQPILSKCFDVFALNTYSNFSIEIITRRRKVGPRRIVGTSDRSQVSAGMSGWFE